jgi:magnesium-protoporphyrin O-methyltransferase
MTCSCSPVFSSTARHFDEKRVRKELAAYRMAGPGTTTQGILDQLRGVGPPPASVLEIGSGIGPLSLELLRAGVPHATCVDMSAAALEANAEEAQRRGVSDRIRQVEADFVAVAPTLPSADLVALDRVVCCYPSYVPLLEQATARSHRLLALSFPRDRWLVRLGLWIENAWRRLRGDRFRAFVHPPVAMASLLRGRGFTRARAASTFAWHVELYVRSPT